MAVQVALLPPTTLIAVEVPLLVMDLLIPKQYILVSTLAVLMEDGNLTVNIASTTTRYA